MIALSSIIVYGDGARKDEHQNCSLQDHNVQKDPTPRRQGAPKPRNSASRIISSQIRRLFSDRSIEITAMSVGASSGRGRRDSNQLPQKEVCRAQGVEKDLVAGSA